MKHNKLFVAGMLAVLLALGFALAGCNNDTPKGEYHLKWGVTSSVTYAQVQSTIASKNWTIADNGADWALATGSTATDVYDWCMDNITTWENGGDVEGSFEECIGFSKGGISAPTDLKTAGNTNKSNVPLAGIFKGGSAAVLFYITKN
jgi:hypothetical protein